MLTIRTRGAAAAVVASFALVGLSACGGSESPKVENTPSPAPATTTSSSTPVTSSAPATTKATTEAPATSGNQPAWAQPATNVGDKIATVKAGDITVDVYQVGITKSTKTGQFVDPNGNKPIIAKGDDIVFVNYVVTNTGAPIDLGSSFVDVEARYDDWKYMQGMDSIVDSALFEQQKVNSKVLTQGAFKTPSVYTLGTGETYSVGENFRYQKNSPITFKVKAVPVDAGGKLIHDKKLEGSGKAVIK